LFLYVLLPTSIIKNNEDLISLSRIYGEIMAFLKKILWNEFIFDEHKDDAEEVNEVFTYL